MHDSENNSWFKNLFSDESKVWNATDLCFTPYYENRVLLIPCFFLWTFAVLDFYYIKNSRLPSNGGNWLYKTKPVFLSLLVTFSVVESVLAETLLNNVNLLDILSPIFQLIALMLVYILVVHNTWSGLRSPGTIFLFWLLFVFSELPRLLILIHNKELKVFLTLLFMKHLCVVISLILSFFAEPIIYVRQPNKENNCPEKESSLLSRITFFWTLSLIKKGFKTDLKSSDLWNLDPENSSKTAFERFSKYWKSDAPSGMLNKGWLICKIIRTFKFESEIPQSPLQTNHQTSISWPLFMAFGSIFISTAVIRICVDMLHLLQPWLINRVVQFTTKNGKYSEGCLYVALFILVSGIIAELHQWGIYKTAILKLKIHNALFPAIFKKALRLPNSVRVETNVTNLLAIDVQQYLQFIENFNNVWVAPLHILLILWLLWTELGTSVFKGIGVLIMVPLLDYFIVSKMINLHNEQLEIKDERVKFTREYLSNMKGVKLKALELFYGEKLSELKIKEMPFIRKILYLQAFSGFIWKMSPYLVSYVTFYYWENNGKNLDEFQPIITFSYLQRLIYPLNLLSHMLKTFSQGQASLKRINKFLNCEEMSDDTSLKTSDVQCRESESFPIIIDEGSFSWERCSELNASLHVPELKVKEGFLVAVVGPSGSGKSSLLSAILGEMQKIGGSISVKGSIAYVAQQSWIQNATIEENIKFGRSQKVSTDVLQACALHPDLEVLPDRENTQIGDQGINLSGGQKQRISLARAIYQYKETDIFLLDNIFGPVDAVVGKQIFHCIIGHEGLLKEKTRIFTTHSPTHLNDVDMIIVLKEKTVVEIGNYNDLISKGGAFVEILNRYQMDQQHDTVDDLIPLLESSSTFDDNSRQMIATDSLSPVNSDSTNSQSRNVNFTESESSSVFDKSLIEEELESGKVKLPVYKDYFKNVLWWFPIIIILLIISQVFQIFPVVTVDLWANPTIQSNSSNTISENFSCIAELGLFSILLQFVANLLICHNLLNSSLRQHKTMLQAVLRTLPFFSDLNIVGRVIVRFTQDIDILDFTLPLEVNFFLCSIIGMAITQLIIISMGWKMMLVGVPVLFCYISIMFYYLATNRQLRRLEAVSRSPIHSLIKESYEGRSTIRAFHAQKRFEAEFEERVDLNQCYNYNYIAVNQWLELWLEFLGIAALLSACIFGLVNAGTPIGSNTFLVIFLVQNEPESKRPQLPDDSWPSKGDLRFVNFSARYSKKQNLVLKNTDFHIKPAEKIGIVGRTGAGKTSLINALFRLLKPESGKVIIDGIDISELSLRDLRSRLCIVQQDPVLFSDSLRINLDPFEKANSDGELLGALEKVSLLTFVNSQGGLEFQIIDAGANLSVGQRQLICLAQALLQQSKLVILDEATSSVDLETDDLIQKTIKEQFKECTVLTIAHRLNTIKGSDKVMVVDNGEVKEFDTPAELMRNRRYSIFRNMCENSHVSFEVANAQP